MRISISSDGYRYQEYIQRTQAAEEAAATNSNNAKIEESEEFNKILDTVMEALKAKIKEELSKANNNPTTTEGNYSGQIPVVNENLSTGDLVISSTTAENYTSIAPSELQPIFKEASETYGIDQKLLELIGYHESAFKSNAVSSAGAVGIMQLMPSTAVGLGVTDSYDARQNIMGGAKLLKNLYDAYNGDLDLVLSGYSAGTGAVRKYGGVPPYAETRNYINWIRERYP